MPSSLVVKQFNESRYQEVGRLSPADAVRLEKIEKLVGSQKRVLDVGCFDGFVGERLIKNGNEVCGLDISEPAVKKAQERGIKAQVANVEEPWPFAEQQFDVVFAGEIIEHLFDTDKFLQQAKRVLKTNGFLILTTPNLASLGRRLFLLFGKNPLIETGCLDARAGHIRYFVKESLTALLKHRNFEIIKFESTVVNFNVKGTLCSRKLAKIFPTLGSTLIVKCQVKKS